MKRMRVQGHSTPTGAILRLDQDYGETATPAHGVSIDGQKEQ